MRLPGCKPHSQPGQASLSPIRGQASRANATEVAAGRLAMDRPTDPAVKRFAKRMVDEHAWVGRELSDAVQVVQRMKADPGLTALLGTAKGVFILPDYGRGALIVGAQAGASAGSMALLLMSDRAVERFRSDRNFSLSADAGLSIGPYSQRT